jgi:5-methylcytosine-specific restriction endonuclease McrA
MIPVTPAPEPSNFDLRIRQKGLNAIAEMVGEKPARKRRGPKRKKLTDMREKIPADAFPPYWREALPEMLESYHHLCAYLALYIHSATGSPSVDHVVPKSKSWDKVYEWSNYRLACALVNAYKNDVELALDPFLISPGLFALEFVEFQVVVGPAAQGNQAAQVTASINTLGLNVRDCRKARQAYVEAYEKDEIRLSYLTRHAPFIAQELRRQGRLLRGDT